MARLYCFGTLVAEEEGGLIASKINHHFLKDDGRMQGTEGQRMYFLRLLQRQFNHLLHHTTGDSGIIDAIDVLRLLVEVIVEVNLNRSTVIKYDLIAKSTYIEIVKS